MDITPTVNHSCGDIVTHLPPIARGYRHVGKTLELGEAGKYGPVDVHRSENIMRELLRFERKNLAVEESDTNEK